MSRPIAWSESRAPSDACAAWMLETAWSRSDLSLEETASADSSPGTRCATVSADSTERVTDALKGVARSFLAEAMLMFPVKPPVFAGRRRPVSRILRAPQAGGEVPRGRPLG